MLTPLQYEATYLDSTELSMIVNYENYHKNAIQPEIHPILTI